VSFAGFSSPAFPLSANVRPDGSTAIGLTTAEPCIQTAGDALVIHGSALPNRRFMRRIIL
jgi:hypothetical protein